MYGSRDVHFSSTSRKSTPTPGGVPIDGGGRRGRACTALESDCGRKTTHQRWGRYDASLLTQQPYSLHRLDSLATTRIDAIVFANVSSYTTFFYLLGAVVPIA